MAKRGRGRRPKRSSRVLPRQDKQLAKEVREHYRPGDEGAWTDLVDSVPTPGRGSSELLASQAGEPLIEVDGAARHRGTVVAVYSGGCRVESVEADETDEGTEASVEAHVVDCLLPSRLAKNQQALLAVGDEVTFALYEGKHRVIEVAPRQTVLSRPDPHNPRKERVIAANVDVVVHVSSLVKPPLRPALIDRYLIAIERGGATPLLLVNKVDLVGEKELAESLAPLDVYRETGFDVLTCSAETGRGLGTLRQALAGQTAVFVGHSGVGKSSLLNALSPSLELTTSQVSERYARGRHTTTRSHLYHLGDGIRLIDTPGIRELGLWHLDPGELSLYFPDFDDAAILCKFSHCTHTHEPRCGVKAAVEEGKIPAGRYATYTRILASLEENNP